MGTFDATTFGISLGLVLATTPAYAAGADDGRPPSQQPIAPEPAGPPPPPSERSYLQYGVALVAEIVASPGPACAAGPNCILGSGGGMVARAGWRPTEALYIGGAYEMTKQDPHQLYRLAILQQLRGEVRWYFPTGRESSPFLLFGAGVSGYGNDWLPVDTSGPNGTLGGGLELQLGGPVLVLSLAYRPTYLHSWVDSSTIEHDAGIAHFVSFEAAIEAQDNL
ncbi:MAG TPA: hypothetical protein VE987_15435 [Polyangiaceae bacterium]|nr:hypothetical protein [Polyangiaceae bacterium]